jgi:hypothetical protein
MPTPEHDEIEVMVRVRYQGHQCGARCVVLKQELLDSPSVVKKAVIVCVDGVLGKLKGDILLAQ